MKLNGRGEFQIIDYLRQKSGTAPDLIKGIGDDCAVTSVAPDEVLLTTSDLLTEGVHFNRNWTGLMQLGRKAVSVNISDLAAMGARPRFLFLSLALPDDLDMVNLDLFLDGFLQACREHGAVLAGGDTCRSNSGLTVSVTAQGIAPTSGWVARDTAVVADNIYVTGTVGDSALALEQLKAGVVVDSFLRGRHIDPTARAAVGLALAAAAIPTAMIDISDGLLGDLDHILKNSGVGASLNLTSLPLSPSFQSELDLSPKLINLALSGGEDYELLFTAHGDSDEAIREISSENGVAITRVGHIVDEAEGLRVFGQAGEIELPAQKGYKHFPETP